MSQYAKALPVDQNNNPYVVSTPNFVSNQSWSGVPITSSTIGLSAQTTVVQIAAVGGPINFKWGPGSVTSSSFDGSIAANAVQVFVVPQSVAGVYPSVQGMNPQNGLYNSISVKAPANSASIFGSEY